MLRTVACSAFVLAFGTACGGSIPDSDVPTVAELDVQRYAGKWYEIATFPQSFQSNCSCVTANYTATPFGVGVRNVCRQNGIDGPVFDIRGRAYMPDANQPGKLKVQFPVPGGGDADYWVFEVAEDYSHAVVTDPYRKTLWILARNRTLDGDVFNGIVQRLQAARFDTTPLRMSEQEGCADVW